MFENTLMENKEDNQLKDIFQLIYHNHLDINDYQDNDKDHAMPLLINLILLFHIKHNLSNLFSIVSAFVFRKQKKTNYLK
jgi:hypothetical protein